MSRRPSRKTADEAAEPSDDAAPPSSGGGEEAPPLASPLARAIAIAGALHEHTVLALTDRDAPEAQRYRVTGRSGEPAGFGATAEEALEAFIRNARARLEAGAEGLEIEARRLRALLEEG